MDREGKYPGLQGMKKEATWCRTCMKRGTCKDKEAVAFEKQMAAGLAPTKYVEVKMWCRGYIKDARLPHSPEVGSIFNL